jgi:chromosome segregation ATPase
MTTAVTERADVVVGGVALVVEFPVSADEIAEAKAKYAALDASTAAGYEAVRLAIGHLRTARTSIEKRRKALKDPGLEFHRKVDAMAALLTEKIEDVEKPLRRKREDADAAAALARRAAEDAARAEAEAKAKAEREAEERRLADERTKLDAETAAFEARRKAADEERAAAEKAERAERERVAAEQREAQAKIDAQSADVEAQARAIRDREEAAARVEAQRQAAARAEQEAREQAERDRVAAEEAAAAEVARAAAEAVRLEALRPDVTKLHIYAGAIRGLADSAPAVQSDEARAAVLWVAGRLATIAGQIEDRFPIAAVA